MNTIECCIPNGNSGVDHFSYQKQLKQYRSQMNSKKVEKKRKKQTNETKQNVTNKCIKSEFGVHDDNV